MSKTLKTEQLTSYQSQIRIRIKLWKNTWDWTTHRLPKPDQNQNQIVKKHLRLNNSHPTKARSESESNCEKTLETEQLTNYQSQIRIRIKLWKNTWDWTTHILWSKWDHTLQILQVHWKFTNSHTVMCSIIGHHCMVVEQVTHKLSSKYNHQHENVKNISSVLEMKQLTPFEVN